MATSCELITKLDKRHWRWKYGYCSLSCELITKLDKRHSLKLCLGF